jgi:hypothetical protein
MYSALLLFFGVQRNRSVCLNFSLQQILRLDYFTLPFLHLGFVFLEMHENQLQINCMGGDSCLHIEFWSC